MTLLSRLLMGAALAAGLAFAAGAGAAPLTPLAVLNPGFETDCGAGTPPCDWTNTGGSPVTRDTIQKHSGAASLKLDTGSGAVALVRGTCVSGVIASTVYYFSFYYRTADPNVGLLLPHVDWYTSSGTCANSPGSLDATVIPINDGAWHFVEVSGAAPNVTTTAVVQLSSFCGGGQTGCVVNYDDVKVDTSATTAVRVASLVAHRSPAGVGLTWRAPSTVDTLGFNVWRSDARGGHYSKLNRSLLLGRGTAYQYRDRTAKPGRAYVYRLQLVRPDGSRIWAASVRVRPMRS